MNILTDRPFADIDLDTQEIERYGRHLALPEVGIEGQKKLKAARVLIVGVGGLGSPAALYLAAAGVGTIGLADADRIERSNLQRQILYSTDVVGQPKLDQARKRLLDLNPHIRVETYPMRLNADNALELIKEYDIVIDGTDNFSARYLINDACAISGKPDVYGAVFRFEGQATVFWTGQGSCYRCLYPEPPNAAGVLDCNAAGVLGVLPGIIGTLQATEAIKLILGIGRPLIGQLLLYDALNADWRKLAVRQNSRCPLCGKRPTIKKLLNYKASCNTKPLRIIRGGDREGGNSMFGTKVPEISVKELKAKMDDKEDIFILDVREKFEYDIARLPGAHLIPLGELPDRLSELERAKQKEIVVHCKGGARSAKAVRFLRDNGFQTAANLAGGISAWSEEVDPSVPQY